MSVVDVLRSLGRASVDVLVLERSRSRRRRRRETRVQFPCLCLVPVSLCSLQYTTPADAEVTEGEETEEKKQQDPRSDTRKRLAHMKSLISMTDLNP